MSVGITDAVIEELKARTDLADLVASYGVDVRQAGSGRVACCPFHHEKTPSFHINVSRGFYHCFGCGETGDAIKFVEKMEGLSFLDAVKKLANACGLKIEEKSDPDAARRKRLYAVMAEVALFYRKCLLELPEADLARRYLIKRDLGSDAQETFLIGYAPMGLTRLEAWAKAQGYTREELEAAGLVGRSKKDETERVYHRFGGRLMFTIRDRQSRVVAFSGRQLVEDKHAGKYVNSPETLIFKKSNVLFGFDRAAGEIGRSPRREVIVCEGQIDCIRLHLSGFKNAVAGQGTAFTEEHVKMLHRVADNAFLVYDDDAAGHKATIRSAAMLLAAGMPVRVVRLPGGDDPDSFLRTKGAAAFRTLLDQAESIVTFQCRVERAKETNPETIDAVTRVTKAVLATVASCSSAILKAGLVDEAARILGLPVAALTEDLAQIKASVSSAPSAVRASVVAPSASVETAPVEVETPVGADAAKVQPPSARELDFLSFLLGHEYDRALADCVGEFLPRSVFSHAFTPVLVDVWRNEVLQGEDLVARFAEGLVAPEREWFDLVLSGAERSQASGLEPMEILEDFIRALWSDALKRRRGDLPANGDAEVDAERLKISMDLQRLRNCQWGTIKELIRDQIRKGE